MRKFFIILLTFQLFLIPNLSAHATLGNSYDYVLMNGSGARSGLSQWALIPYGTIIVGSLLYSAIANKPRGNSDIWDVVTEFEPQKAVNNKELEDTEKKVSFINEGKAATNISVPEQNFIFNNSDMKNRNLHLYQVIIPDELLQSKQKLVVDTTLIYKNPKEGQLDFRILKKTDLKKAEAEINNKNSEKLVRQEGNNFAYVLQRELKINPTKKSFTLAVYMPSCEKNKNETISPIKYVALVKIRPIVNKF